jgi:hypothetical protein
MTKKTQMLTGLIVLIMFLGGVVGCAPPAPPQAAPSATLPAPTPTVLPGWQTYSNQGPCGYAIDYPSAMAGTHQDAHSWLLNHPATESDAPFPNFIYVSVIPDEFTTGGDEIIYNYDPAATQTLLGLQVGESRSLHGEPTLAPWFTYTRLPDTVLDDQAAQTYENTQPWEFPPGTKEIRYYLKGNRCTYLIGGYMSTVGSGQTGAIDEESFDQIIASFRLASGQ